MLFLIKTSLDKEIKNILKKITKILWEFDLMKMEDFLSENLIDLSLNAKSKEEAITSLCQRLYDNNYVDSVEGFVSDVYQREEEGETGIGQGIAIPHGKSENVIKTGLAIGRTNTIDWEGEEHQPVEIIILFAVKLVDHTSVHLKLLSQVASKLGNDENLVKMKEAEEPSEVIDIFIN